MLVRIMSTTAQRLYKAAKEVHDKRINGELTEILDSCEKAAKAGQFEVQVSWISEDVRKQLQAQPHCFIVTQTRTGINEDCWTVSFGPHKT